MQTRAPRIAGVALLTLVLAPLSGQAGDNGWDIYGGVFIGASKVQSFDADLSAASEGTALRVLDREGQTGFEFGLSFGGWSQNPDGGFRWGLRTDLASAEADSNTQAQLASGVLRGNRFDGVLVFAADESRTTNLMQNFMVGWSGPEEDDHPYGRWGVHAGGGLGIQWLSSDVASAGRANDGAIAIQFVAGGEYNVARHLGIVGDLRFLRVRHGLNLGSSVNTATTWQHNFLLGLTYHFH